MGDLRKRENNSWKAHWTFGILFILVIISKVKSQVVVTERPENVTAVLGQTLVLKCVFSEPVFCNWQRDTQVLMVAEGYSYTSGRKSDERAADCSLKIASIDDMDFAKWRCGTYATKVSAVSSDDVWISKQVTPTDPVILFKNKKISEIKLPTIDSPSNLVCISQNGNPPPKLSWELKGRPYLGRLENIGEGSNLHSVRLIWDRMGEWEIFNETDRIVCKADHVGFGKPRAAVVSLKRNYAPKVVKVWADSTDGNEVQVGSSDKISLACISDGQPAPTYTWEVWSASEETWKVYINDQNITVNISLIGKYRCKASNDLNNSKPTPSLNELVVSEKKAEVTSTGVIIGIVVGCALLIMILVLIFIYLKRKQKSPPSDKDGHVPVEDGRDPEAVDETTEKTALSDVAYDSVQQNGQEDKQNGKTDISPIKVDQNVNKKPDEVVYAQLDLGLKDTAKVRTPSEPEKTEYAEIRFNQDNHQNSHPA